MQDHAVRIDQDGGHSRKLEGISHASRMGARKQRLERVETQCALSPIWAQE